MKNQHQKGFRNCSARGTVTGFPLPKEKINPFSAAESYL